MHNRIHCTLPSCEPTPSLTASRTLSNRATCRAFAKMSASLDLNERGVKSTCLSKSPITSKTDPLSSCQVSEYGLDTAVAFRLHINTTITLRQRMPPVESGRDADSLPCADEVTVDVREESFSQTREKSEHIVHNSMNTLLVLVVVFRSPVHSTSVQTGNRRSLMSRGPRKPFVLFCFVSNGLEDTTTLHLNRRQSAPGLRTLTTQNPLLSVQWSTLSEHTHRVVPEQVFHHISLLFQPILVNGATISAA